jgi:hypothetical protein
LFCCSSVWLRCREEKQPPWWIWRLFKNTHDSELGSWWTRRIDVAKCREQPHWCCFTRHVPFC